MWILYESPFCLKTHNGHYSIANRVNIMKSKFELYIRINGINAVDKNSWSPEEPKASTSTRGLLFSLMVKEMFILLTLSGEGC